MPELEAIRGELEVRMLVISFHLTARARVRLSAASSRVPRVELADTRAPTLELARPRILARAR